MDIEPILSLQTRFSKASSGWAPFSSSPISLLFFYPDTAFSIYKKQGCSYIICKDRFGDYLPFLPIDADLIDIKAMGIRHLENILMPQAVALKKTFPSARVERSDVEFVYSKEGIEAGSKSRRYLLNRAARRGVSVVVLDAPLLEETEEIVDDWAAGKAARAKTAREQANLYSNADLQKKALRLDKRPKGLTYFYLLSDDKRPVGYTAGIGCGVFFVILYEAIMYNQRDMASFLFYNACRWAFEKGFQFINTLGIEDCGVLDINKMAYKPLCLFPLYRCYV